jgi:hypothetical protein
MSEGVQDAADAFRQTIAPETISDRRRDQAGRFAATARPETMFEPRPVEGDPLTGDTRDGGENARLANMERRIADGRAEQGDEDGLRRGVQRRSGRGETAGRQDQRLSDRDQGARSAAGDGGHERGREGAEGERGDVQERIGDQDPQEPDEGASPEGTPEQDAEGEDEPKYEVTVDGQTQEVPLSEALRGYIREQTFKQRMTHIDQARGAIEQEAQTVVQARDAYMQRLQYMDRLLQEFTPPEPNWDQEFAQNSSAAYAKQKAYAEIYQKRAAIDQELQRTAAEQQQQYDQRSQKYAVDQFARFVQKANIKDERQLNERMQAMREYGRHIGFNEHELASTYDERMLAVLDEAAQNWTARRDIPKPVSPGQGKTLVPGVATPRGNATRRILDVDQSRLAKTGKLDDAALVFRHFLR